MPVIPSRIPRRPAPSTPASTSGTSTPLPPIAPLNLQHSRLNKNRRDNPISPNTALAHEIQLQLINSSNPSDTPSGRPRLVEVSTKSSISRASQPKPASTLSSPNPPRIPRAPLTKAHQAPNSPHELSPVLPPKSLQRPPVPKSHTSTDLLKHQNKVETQNIPRMVSAPAATSFRSRLANTNLSVEDFGSGGSSPSRLPVLAMTKSGSGLVVAGTMEACMPTVAVLEGQETAAASELVEGKIRCTVMRDGALENTSVGSLVDQRGPLRTKEPINEAVLKPPSNKGQRHWQESPIRTLRHFSDFPLPTFIPKFTSKPSAAAARNALDTCPSTPSLSNSSPTISMPPPKHPDIGPFQPLPVKSLLPAKGMEAEPRHIHKVHIDNSYSGVSIHKKEEGVCIYSTRPGYGILGQLCSPTPTSTSPNDSNDLDNKVNGGSGGNYSFGVPPENGDTATSELHTSTGPKETQIDVDITSVASLSTSETTASTPAEKSVFVFRLIPITANVPKPHREWTRPSTPASSSTKPPLPIDGASEEIIIEPDRNETFAPGLLLKVYDEVPRSSTPWTPLSRHGLGQADAKTAEIRKRWEERIRIETGDEAMEAMEVTMADVQLEISEGLSEEKREEVLARMRVEMRERKTREMRMEMKAEMMAVVRGDLGKRVWQAERTCRKVFLPYAAKRRGSGGDVSSL